MKHDRTSDLEQELQRENVPKVAYLFRLFSFVFSSAKSMCIFFLSLSILLSLLRPVMAFIWGKYVDQVNEFAEMLSLVGLLVIYFIIGFVIDLLARYTESSEEIERLDIVQSNRFQEQVDTKLYSKIASLPPEYWEVAKLNDTIGQVLNFTGNAWDGLSKAVMVQGYSMIARLISVISIAITLYMFHPILCVIVLIAPIPTLFTTYISDKLQFRFVSDNTQLLRQAGYFEGLLLGNSAKEIKAFHLFDFIFEKWKALSDEYTVKEKKMQLRASYLRIFSQTISSLATVAANILAIVFMAKGILSIGALGAVLSLTNTLVQDMGSFLKSIGTFINKKNEAARFFDLMDCKEQRADGIDINKKTIQKMDVVVSAKNLSYRYPFTDIPVLNNVNLIIRKGETVALVGENGAGKTTFVKQIAGMLEPTAGSLEFMGVSVDEMKASSRYQNMSAVFQDAARYNTFSIAENVFLGDVTKEFDLDKAKSALDFAKFDGPSPEQLLGKDLGGTDLSGGQWQKIAIARAYYRGKDFIILDEPTSNLDPQSETETFQSYLNLMENTTVVLVTHRISIASLADRVIVFQNGCIVEDGTHDSLIQQQGEYSRLYKAQAQWYDR